MKLLLDTHIWIWYRLGNPRLSTTLQTEIANEENELWLSPISLWETLILTERGRLVLEPTPKQWIETSLQELEAKPALLTHEIALLSRELNLPHQDPADRFIAASAVYYGLILATVDNNLTPADFLTTIS